MNEVLGLAEKVGYSIKSDQPTPVQLLDKILDLVLEQRKVTADIDKTMTEIEQVQTRNTITEYKRSIMLINEILDPNIKLKDPAVYLPLAEKDQESFRNIWNEQLNFIANHDSLVNERVRLMEKVQECTGDMAHH